MWELVAAVAGWNRSQGGEDSPPELTDAEVEDMIARHSDWLSS